MKNLLMMFTVVFMCTAHARPPLLDELERGGLVRGIGECIWNRHKYDCVALKYNSDHYFLLGSLVENGLDVKHILKFDGDELKEIWSHTWVQI